MEVTFKSVPGKTHPNFNIIGKQKHLCEKTKKNEIAPIFLSFVWKLIVFLVFHGFWGLGRNGPKFGRTHKTTNFWVWLKLKQYKDYQIAIK